MHKTQLTGAPRPVQRSVNWYGQGAPMRKHPTESQEQQALIRWFDLNYPGLSTLFFHIPNGGDRHVLVAKKMKAEGVRRGIPDLMLALPVGGFHGLFVEMKARGGRPTLEQLAVIGMLESQGYKAVVCRGFEEAAAAVKSYVGEYANRWRCGDG